MSVYKRGDKGVFYMNFTVHGQRIFRSTGKYTKREAKQVEARERLKLLSGEAQEGRGVIKLKDAIEQVYESKWKSNKDGMGSYRRAVNLLKHMDNMSLVTIGEYEVNQLVVKLEASGVKVATVNRYLATLKTILKHYRLSAD